MVFECFVNPHEPQKAFDILFARIYNSCSSIRDLQDWLGARRTAEEVYFTSTQNSGNACPVEIISKQLLILAANHKNVSTGLDTLIARLSSFQKDNQNWASVLKLAQNPVQFKKYELGFSKLTGLLQFQIDRLGRAKEKNKGDKKTAEVNDEISKLSPKWKSESTALFTRFEEMERARLSLFKQIWDDYSALLLVIDVAGAVSIKETISGMNVDDELLAFCLSSGMEMEPAIPAEIPTVQVDADGFAIKPENVDIFKAAKDQDDGAFDIPSPSKITVAIKKEAIVEDEKVSYDIMKLMSSQLQKERIRVNSEPISSSPKAEVQYASSLPAKTSNSSIDDIQSTFYITETINAYINQGIIQNSLVTGELGLNLFTLPDPILSFDTKGLKNVTVNKQFLNDDLKFDMETLKSVQGSSIVLLKYQVDTDIPMISPVFKVETDSVSILIDIKSKIRLDVIKVTAGFEMDGAVGRVESMPIAQWDLDSKELVWEVDSDCDRLVGRIEGNGLIPKPVTVEFEGSTTKGVVEGDRKVVSGLFTSVGRTLS